MTGKQMLLFANLLLTAIVVFPITFFFAGGTIAENYSGDQWPAPGFFNILVLWAAGVLFYAIYWFKTRSKMLVFLYLLFTWLAVPVGIEIGFYIELNLLPQ